MSSVVPILIVAAVGGAFVLGGTKKRSGARRVTPGKVAQPSVPAWCKAPWDSQRTMQVLGVVERYVAELPYYGDTDGARQQTFTTTKAVIAEICGGVELPPEYYNLTGFYESKPQWWRDLWDRVSGWVWNAIIGPVD